MKEEKIFEEEIQELKVNHFHLISLNEGILNKGELGVQALTDSCCMRSQRCKAGC